MNSRAAASVAGTVSVALMVLSGCNGGNASPEVTTKFNATWAKLSGKDKKTACWAVTAQGLSDQQAQAMSFLSDTFGKDWDKMSDLISRHC